MSKQVAITDYHGNPTRETTSIDEATNRGLWHLGVHAIIYTSDGRVLIQERSERAAPFPGMIELSLSGFVYAGESPAAAAIRVIREQTGSVVTEDDLLPIGPSHHDYHWQHGKQQKRTRVVLHNFAVQLTDESVLKQSGKVISSAQFIPYKTARHLVLLGRLHDIGRIVPLRAHYLRLLRFMRHHR